MAGALSGCADTTGSRDTPQVTSDALGGGSSVIIVDRGWHTDIALSAEAISGPVAALGTDFPGVRFLVFGFGDQAYYMAHGSTFLGMLEALFPGPGVILVTALKAPPADAFGGDHVVTLQLSSGQLSAITASIKRSLQRQPNGLMQKLGDGPYPGSLFYASGETYDVFHNCNHWTLATLHSGGLPTNPEGAIFSGQVMEQVRRIAAEQERRMQSSSDMNAADER